MLYNLLTPLSEDISIFNLFRYLTFRTGGAVVTAMFISFLIGPYFIRWAKKIQRGSNTIRKYTPDTHFAKAGTPTMGGVMILFSITLSSLIWVDITNVYFWIVLLVTLGYGLIGFVDDWLKISRKNSRGISAKIKILGQIFFALVAVVLYQNTVGEGLSTTVSIPFTKNFLLDLGGLFLPFAIFVIIGTSNAVNLTDGLDGLASVPIAVTAACFGFIAYLIGNTIYAHYLKIPYVAGAGELAIFAGSIVGASMGFLWFNSPPAMIFMGDTGSLSLGGALGSIAVIVKNEIVLAIIGGIFVLETLSVIIQVVSFKTTGKRIFAMAPLHHHYEKKGWSESTIVIRFWIITVILAIIGLSTLKLR